MENINPSANQNTTATSTPVLETQSSPVTPAITSPASDTGSFIQDTTQRPLSDKKFYAVVFFIALVVVGVGSFLIYRSYLDRASIPLSEITTDTTSISDFAEQPPPEKKDLSEFNYITPPEGDDVLLPQGNTTTPQKSMRRYDNYQYSFSFEYENKPHYQTLQCYTSGSKQTEATENKLVFYDSTNVTSNELLYAHCNSSNTTHLAKVIYSQASVACLGASETRTIPTGTAVQCSGKTSSTSSTDNSLSLLISKGSGTILIEVNSPDHTELIQDAAASFSFETKQPDTSSSTN